jgi:hypothetical protein
MDAVGSSLATLNSCQATRCHVSGDSIITLICLYGCESSWININLGVVFILLYQQMHHGAFIGIVKEKLIQTAGNEQL